MFANSLRYMMDILTESALVYPAPSFGKIGEAAFGSGKSLCDEVEKNTEPHNVEDDVKTFSSSSSNGSVWYSANDDDIDCMSYRSAESNLNCTTASSFYQDVMEPESSAVEPICLILPTNPTCHKIESERSNRSDKQKREEDCVCVQENVSRSLQNVVSSFADENASFDQRAHDLSVINDSIENTRNYMARCCLRNSLMSLGVLKGVTLASKTDHPALSRELQRLVEFEAKDLIIQETPDDASDQRCAVDLLYDWFDASKDSLELARKQCLLRILVRNRNLTEPIWSQLLPSISKVLDVPIECDGEKSIVKESNARRRTLADIITRKDDSSTSCFEYGKQQPCSTSSGQTSSDHGEKINTASSAIEKNSLASNDLFLMTVAPMPKIKTRPRSISRHRASSRALIPRTDQREETRPIDSKNPPSPTPLLTNTIRATKGQSFSMCFVASTSPIKSRQTAPTYVPFVSASLPIPSASTLPCVPTSSNPLPVPSVQAPSPAPPPPPPLVLHTLPPPPPPPPPPSVLGRPGLSTMSVSQACAAHSKEVYPKKTKTYTLLWQAVSQSDITNVHTVWNEYSRPEFSVEERNHVQLLFGREELVSRRLPSERKSKPDSSKPGTEFQLPLQKALNLEIILAKLRPLTVMDLIVQLESNNIDGLSVDLLSSLVKYFPTEEEMFMFKKVTREDIKRSCDVLCWEAARRSTLKIKMELAIAREQILQDLALHSNSTRRLRDACDALRSPILIHLLHKCLQYGNFINQGSAISSAVGFSLTSLPSVLTAKGKRDNALNLRIVDILAEYVEFDTTALESVVTSLQSAKLMKLNDIEAASKEISSSVCRLQKHLVSKGSGDVSLLTAYQTFLENAESSSLSLASELQDLRVVETSLQLFLCANSMKLEGIIAITLEALTMLSESIRTRTLMKLQMKLQPSTRLKAGRETLTPRKGNHQAIPFSVEALKEMFLKAANQ